MPRYYQRKKNNPYYIPGSLYDYIIACIIYAAPFLDDPESVNKQTKPLQAEIELIKENVERIPETYRAAVIDSLVHQSACPEEINKRIFSDIRSCLIYNIAKDLRLTF